MGHSNSLLFSNLRQQPAIEPRRICDVKPRPPSP
jgi:hypothetical protein